MPKKSDRRRFIQQTIAGGTGAALAGTSSVFGKKSFSILESSSPNSRLNIAGIGVAGKGASDLRFSSKEQNVVAICDVDLNSLDKAAEVYPKARKYQDWRKLLEQHDVEAVTISTPDHMHAPIAMTAMKLGKHVYVQKPLTHTIFEARQLTRVARQADIATQMGNQHHSGSGYRTVREIIRQGIIGKVKEAHTWSNRPIWPQGVDRPQGSDPIPPYLDWQIWLGVAPYRPFVGVRGESTRNRGAYHPFNWRGWLDFGVGALGDMGCHIIDPVVWSLQLGPPETVSAECPEINGETYPEWETITYEFAPTELTSGNLKMAWHDGGRKPDRKLIPLPEEEETPSNGSLFLGEKGVLLCEHGEMPQLLPRNEFAGVKIPIVAEDNHYEQWTQACKGEGSPTSHFGYSGPLTETVLLGTIAIRFPGEELKWDSEGLSFVNSRRATEFVHHAYRKGWEVEGLG